MAEPRPQQRDACAPFWGILFLFLGVVFLLQTLNILPWGLWRTLGRLWPVLIIALGICLAMRRFNAWLVSLIILALFSGALGIAYWQYGGGLALMPSYTADFFGPKNLGMNYGIVFLGWGLGFFMTRLGGSIKDWTGTLDWAFYLSALVLIAAVLLSWITKRPMLEHER